MTRYVALLRGINVGGHAKIAMAELRALLADLGFTDVATHLQSGNAVLTSPEKNPDKVIATLERGITDTFGHSVRCLVRTAAQMRAVVGADPFQGIAGDGSRYLVLFLSAPLDGDTARAEKLAALDPASFAPDEFRVMGREIYMWCPGGLRDAKIAKVPWERRFGVIASGRNWNTVTKLADMAEDDMAEG